MIGAGAVVPANTKIEKNQIWVGNPAKFLRTNDSQIQDFI